MVLLGVPISVLAQVSIVEIMYDLEGSDSGREWVEVFNGGGSDVDLFDWRFFEGETNHKLTTVQGGSALAPGGYAVIADNATQFLGDHAGFSGVLFDSSFSLGNTGELLALRDGALADTDSVTYSSEWGAVGDGLSLQKSGGSWIAASPTPGAANATTPVPAPTSGGGSSSGGSSAGTGGSSESGSTPPAGGGTSSGSTGGGSLSAAKPEISARTSGPSAVTVGALAEFRGEAIGFKGEPLENARLIWNFGDGSSGEGRAVLHSWRHPGEYVVVLSLASGEYTATARLTVRAAAAALTISAVAEGASGFIELTNEGKQDVDLSAWRLHAGERHFTFPKNTILVAGAALRFGAETTGLVVARGEQVALLYPNGSIVVEYKWPAFPSAGVSVDGSAAFIGAVTERVVAAAASSASATDAQTTSRSPASRQPTRPSSGRAPTVVPYIAPEPTTSARESSTTNTDAASAAGLTGIGALDLPPPAAGCEGAAGGAFFSGRLGMYLAALGGLTALGVLAFLASRARALEVAPVSEADGYEIVEE
ncbi:MAG: lamin tail domain-containing protein [bacterium]|nr:lamin tail domain-containing protein [bacterium]